MSRISPQRPKVQRDGSCMAAFFSHRRYAEHIEIGKSPATPCQRQNPGKNACRLKSATISSPEGFCSISCLYEQSSPCRRKTWRFSLHRKIYFKQTTGRPGQLSEGFPQNRSFPFQKSGMKKGASFWMRPVQIMPAANLLLAAEIRREDQELVADVLAPSLGNEGILKVVVVVQFQGLGTLGSRENQNRCGWQCRAF